MSYTKWWHSALIATSLASWGLAQILYGYAMERDLLSNATGSSILLLMLAYQGLPFLALILVDRFVIRIWGGDKVLRFYRASLFGIVLLISFRAISFEWRPLLLDGLPVAGGSILAVVLLGIFIGVCLRFYPQVALLFIIVSVGSIISTGHFVAQVGLLGKLSADQPVEEVRSQAVADKDVGPVFFIVFDALGGDVLLSDGEPDATRYPNFAALGRDAAVFTNATSNYFSSPVSFGSLMTGTFYSDDSQFHDGPSGAGSDGILSTLMDSQYEVEFYSNIFRCEDQGFRVCRDSVSAAGDNVHMVARDFGVWFLPKGLTRTVRDVVLNLSPREVSLRIPFNPLHRNSRSMWDEFLNSIGEVESPGRAYFVHSLLPHQPYEFDRYGRRLSGAATDVGFDDFDRMFGAYQEQVMYVDALLGEFIDKLRVEGLYEESLVVITSDHGPRSLSLGEAYNGFDTIDQYPKDLYVAIPDVPLIVHGPGITPQISDIDYQHIDMMPTILDVLELPARPELPGVSVFDSVRPDRQKVFFGIPNKAQPGEKAAYIFDQISAEWRMVDPAD